MKAKGTFLLALVFAVLCLGYWGMLRWEQRGRIQAFQEKRLFAFNPEDVREIEVMRLGEPTVSGNRKDGGLWQITQPNPAIEANLVLWDRMAAALAVLTNNRTIEDRPADLATYGLDNPVLIIKAKAADQEDIEIKFGSIEATQTFRYAMIKDGPVFLAAAKIFSELDRGLDVLRYPYVVNIGQEVVRRVEFARFWQGAGQSSDPDRKVGDESVVLAADRQGDGKWKIVEPIQAEGNAEAIEALVKEVQFATGRNYVDAPKNLKDYGLDPPRARVTLYSGDQSPQTVLLGGLESNDPKTGGGLFAKNADKPSVFVMSPNVITLLPEAPSTWREARLIPTAATEFVSVDYSAAGNTFTLTQNEKTGWAVTQPQIADSDQVAISSFLAFLSALKGEEFPGDMRPEYGFDQPCISLTVNLKNQQQEKVLVGAEIPGSGQRYVLQSNGVVTTLSPLAVRGLTKSAEDFRKLTLMEFPREQAIRISVELDGVLYSLDRSRGQWTLVEPANHVITSASDIDAMLRALSNVRAVDIESSAVPADLAPYALDKPVMTVTVVARPGTDPGEKAYGPLKIGGVSTANSQERYASCDSAIGVYRVRQSLLDEVRESLKGIRPM